jgi:hypothetical protein
MGQKETATKRAETYALFADFRLPTERHTYKSDPPHNALYRLAELAWQRKEELSGKDDVRRRTARGEIVNQALAYIEDPDNQPPLSHKWLPTTLM